MNAINKKVFCLAVQEKIGRKLSSDEESIIKVYLSQLSIDRLTSIKLAFKFHLEQVVNELNKRKVPDVELKEWQITSIGTNKEDTQLVNIKHKEFPDEKELYTAESAKLEALFLIEIGEVYDLSKAIAPKSKLKYNYLMLDSYNCYDIPASRDKFTWLLREGSPILQQGYINLHAEIRNIKMARLGRITFAHMTSTFTDQAINRNRFAFGFEEFTSQALITPDNTKFQFIGFLPEYDTNYGTNIVLSSFNENRGWFKFRESFKMLDKLTLTVTNLNLSTKVVVPDVESSFNASRTFPSGVTINGVTTLNPINVNKNYIPINYYYGMIGFEYDVPGDAGEPVTFSDFNSGNPVIDDAYNTGQKILQWTAVTDYFSVISGSAPVAPNGIYNFLIHLIYKPRFTGVLELISEDDNDDDTPI